MSYTKEMCLFLLQNKELIEERSLTEEVELTLFKAINARIEKTVKSLNNWKGHFALCTGEAEDNIDTFFAPLHWPLKPNREPMAGYSIDESQEDVNTYWLSHALGTNNAELCLEFWVDGRVGGPSKARVKEQVEAFYADTPELRKAGFIYKPDRMIYLPFHFDVALVTKEYPDFKLTLAPLDAALDKLLAFHKQFDALVELIVPIPAAAAQTPKEAKK